MRTALAERIVDDPSGEPLAVAMASLGAPGDVLVRVLIAKDLQAGETYLRIRAIARLNNALTRNAAATVMAALLNGPHGPQARAIACNSRAAARARSSRSGTVGEPAAAQGPCPKRR